MKIWRLRINGFPLFGWNLQPVIPNVRRWISDVNKAPGTSTKIRREVWGFMWSGRAPCFQRPRFDTREFCDSGARETNCMWAMALRRKHSSLLDRASYVRKPRGSRGIERIWRKAVNRTKVGETVSLRQRSEKVWERENCEGKIAKFWSLNLAGFMFRVLKIYRFYFSFSLPVAEWIFRLTCSRNMLLPFSSNSYSKRAVDFFGHASGEFFGEFACQILRPSPVYEYWNCHAPLNLWACSKSPCHGQMLDAGVRIGAAPMTATEKRADLPHQIIAFPSTEGKKRPQRSQGDMRQT